MSGTTRIEWADRVWNPVTGCSKVSIGCKHCYAERMAKRLAGRCGYPAERPFSVTVHEDRITEPLRWRKSAMIFVCSMSDLFHQDVPERTIIDVLSTIAEAHYRGLKHTFLILTKRPERMLDVLTSPTVHNDVWLQTSRGVNAERAPWPLPNLWLGVSAENQPTAAERIPFLLDTPAALRFVSCEPLLGPVSLMGYRREAGNGCWDSWLDDLDWVIAGGESGPRAHPAHPDWIRQLRDECDSKGVPFYFKQWGEWAPRTECDLSACSGKLREVLMNPGEIPVYKVGKRIAGRSIDDRTWEQFPQPRR